MRSEVTAEILSLDDLGVFHSEFLFLKPRTGLEKEETYFHSQSKNTSELSKWSIDCTFALMEIFFNVTPSTFTHLPVQLTNGHLLACRALRPKAHRKQFQSSAKYISAFRKLGMGLQPPIFDLWSACSLVH